MIGATLINSPTFRRTSGFAKLLAIVPRRSAVRPRRAPSLRWSARSVQYSWRTNISEILFPPCLRVIRFHEIQLRRPCVRLHLLDALAARDHAAHGRVLQAPCQRPLGHRHTGRDFGLRDLRNLTQLRVDLLLLLARADVRSA